MVDDAEKLSILEVALDLFGDKLKKQKYGEKYKMLCPFHEEKHPSFFIMPKGNFYKCYGCGSLGGPVTLVRDYFKGGSLEILMYLESRGLDLNKEEKQVDLLLEEEFWKFS